MFKYFPFNSDIMFNKYVLYIINTILKTFKILNIVHKNVFKGEKLYDLIPKLSFILPNGFPDDLVIYNVIYNF